MGLNDEFSDSNKENHKWMLTPTMINYLANYTHIETRKSFMSIIAEFYKDILNKLFLKIARINSNEEEQNKI